MDFDFNLILVPLTLVFFGLWLLDKFVLKQRETKGRGEESFIITWAYDFWPVLAVVLVLRSFVFEPFNIPSESMVPTLQTGDYILVNKYQYGIRMPITNSKLISVGEPQRGEVAVFRYPENPKISYIKRIVGLPGDTLKFENGVLFVNGQKQERTFAANTTINAKANEMGGQQVMVDLAGTKYSSTLGEHHFTTQEINSEQTTPDAKAYVQNVERMYPLSHEQNWEVKVPDGKYFAMGDNRDQSADSRFWGFVPEENLTGHAVYVWMHKEPGWHLPSFSRNGKID